jgi:hypothetical protein
MSQDETWKQLVETTGSEEKAAEVMKIMNTTGHVTNTQLSAKQKQLYDYLVSGKPILTQRQLASDSGLGHPQNMVAAAAGLLMKGYLIPRLPGE